MAVDFKVENKRSSTYLIAPELIAINPDMNGRHDLPDIEWLIESFIKNGQRTPVQITNDGGTPTLVAGHCRWRSAIEINKRKLTPEPFKLNCSYYKSTSELDSYLATISENYDRTAPKPIDEAHQIALLERYGMSIEDMAKKVYRQDVQWIKDRQALIGLCDEAQKAVSSGEIKKISAAKALAKLSKTAQREALKQAKESGTKLTAASLKTGAVSKSDRTKKLSLSDWTEFWSPYSDGAECSMKRLASAWLESTTEGDPDSFFKALTGELKRASKAA
jgi:ParB-like chromosome segregation protein Spo0J